MFTQKVSKINNLFLKRFIKLIRYIGVPNLIRKKYMVINILNLIKRLNLQKN